MEGLKEKLKFSHLFVKKCGKTVKPLHMSGLHRTAHQIKGHKKEKLKRVVNITS